MSNRQLIVCVGLVLGLCGSVAADQTGGALRRELPPAPGGDVEPSAIRFTSPWSPNGVTAFATRVTGTVIDIRQIPVPNAQLQLRNLSTGLVEQEGESNGDGEYLFDLTEPGTYVVEMVLVDGYVVALSNAGTVGRYETMQTVVHLPGRWDAAGRRVVMEQRLANYFGMSAEQTMTAQTMSIATDQHISTTDSGEPVSPTTPKP